MTSVLGIRTRIGLLATIVTVWLLSLVAVAGYLVALNAARQTQIDQLNERLDVVEAQLAEDGPRLVSQLGLESRVQVVRSGELPPLPQAATVLVSRPSTVDGVDAIVGFASTRQLDDAFRTIRFGMWISILVTGLVVGTVAWLVVDRSLRPVRELTHQARTIEDDPSHQLLVVDASGDELSELASTFNDMITRLRSADVERRRFVSDASHELRSPLMVLTAEAEYALAHQTETAQGEALGESVLTQTERLTELVDDLLALAAIDEGRPVADPPIAIADVLAAANATSLSADVGSADVDATVDLSVHVPDVSRAVSNIIANARRHCDNEVRLTVDVDRMAGTAALVVDDDGPGIPIADRELVFRRFARLDDSRRRSEGGTGLGLAIARAEVNRAGGQITVGDSPLGGARFSIVVPRMSVELAEGVTLPER